MCLVKSPKMPAPPPVPRAEPRDEAELRERRRLVRRQGQFISPFATAAQSYANPVAPRTLLGG